MTLLIKMSTVITIIAMVGETSRITPFDRFDKQKPHCNFGMAGVCCRNCNNGPCRITRKRPRGVCGADADLIVARNLLRWVAAGVAAHGARGREIMLALKASAEGSLKLPIAGEEKLRKSANQLGINTEGETILTDPQRLPIKINNACIGAKK